MKHFSAKLAELYLDPYRIYKIMSPSVYELEMQSGKHQGKVHVWFLKKFVPNFN